MDSAPLRQLFSTAGQRVTDSEEVREYVGLASTLTDRIAQTTVKFVLEPMLETLFLRDS